MDGELNKAQKLVKILELMMRRGGVKTSDLMERFDLDSRSLRRYLADLRELGIPLDDDGRGDDRLVAVDPQWRRTGVQLSLSEVLSLHFGRRLFNFLEGTSFVSDIGGFIERLEPAISRTHQDLARQLDTKFLAVAEGAKDYRGDTSELVDEAVTALVYNNPVKANYRKARGMAKEYLLHPYTLAVFRQGLYLFAFDVEAGQVKTFALERFTDIVRIRTERFEPPPGWRPEAHIAHAFGIISGPPEHVVLGFSEERSAYIRERTWHPSQVIGTLPDGRLMLKMTVATTVELTTWILGFGDDVEVLGPPGLVDQIRETLDRAADRYVRRR